MAISVPLALNGRFSLIGYFAVSLLPAFDRVPPTISIPMELRSPLFARAVEKFKARP